MTSEQIAILILIVTIILYFSEIIPVYMTAMLSALAMVFFNIISYKDVFKNLSSDIILLIIGMAVISNALSENGIIKYISHFLLKFAKMNEKYFILYAFLLAALSATILSSTVSLYMFLPVIDDIVKRSNGKFAYRHLYMTTAIGALFGGTITSVGTTSVMNASALLVSSGYNRGMHFFEPGRIMVPIIICVALSHLLFVYKVQKKVFHFEDTPIGITEKKNQITSSLFKKIVCIIVLVFCIISFIFEVLSPGFTAMIGAMILILTKCVNDKDIFKSVNWNMVFVVVGSLGFATGLYESGATTYLVELFTRFLHLSEVHTFVPCISLLFISTLFSNFMTNNSTVAITVPIAIQLAESFGIDAMALVMACAIGSNISLATPVCTSNIMIVNACGYRFKDHLIIGGLYNLIAFVVAAVMLYLTYFI